MWYTCLADGIERLPHLLLELPRRRLLLLSRPLQLDLAMDLSARLQVNLGKEEGKLLSFKAFIVGVYRGLLY